MDEISRPISPGDEHLDYLPTQAVPEFLSAHLSFEMGKSKGKRSIGAIIYQSAQRPNGKNIALLGAAGVLGEKTLQEADKADRSGDPFSWFDIVMRVYGTRIVPVPNSFESFMVSSADYSTVP